MTLIEAERARPQTGGKDSALRDWVRALEATAPIAANPQRILPRVIEELAETRGDAPALLSARECLTYRALDDRVNRYARWALEQNLGKGEAVCLVMPNRPEYMAIWLGITKVGAVVSLINTNLRGSALAHCLDIVAPKHIIVAAELCDDVRAALALMASRPKIWSHGSDDFARIDRAIEKLSGGRLTEAERRGVTIADRALHIYTSGTTGLPKAANVSHHRLMQWSFWFAGLMNTGPDDRMYDCLPLYHSVGGVVATGAVLVRGGAVVIRERFSAQRILGRRGQLGLHAVPIYRRAVPLSGQCAGTAARTSSTGCACAAATGCAPTFGKNSRTGFAIPKILEFYAATEGNVSLYNVEGKVGAIGRVPSFLAHRFPLALVKFDAATQRADARRERALHPLRDRRSRRGDRQDSRRRGSCRRPNSRAIPTPRHRRKKSCATCSSAATPGTAPAI